MLDTKVKVSDNSEIVRIFTAACKSIKNRPIDIHAISHDASHYLLTPKLIAVPSDINEVSSLLAAATKTKMPVTFRSGGTSLSGQAVTDGLLIDTRSSFRKIVTKDAGKSISVEPGSTVRAVNSRLLRFGRILGPDPASEIACTIGGVIANNSSGITCGIHANSYKTLSALTFVLPSGTTIDTSRADADELLKTKEPQIYEGLIKLRERIISNSNSMAIINNLYSLKNTMGYGLNSFVDYQRPIDILEHLIVGSEGTLAFVAEATFKTLPIAANCATSLLIFKNLADATSALPHLLKMDFAAIELMDAASLKIGQNDSEAPNELLKLDIDEHAALLVEFRENNRDVLNQKIQNATMRLKDLNLVQGASFVEDAKIRESLWHIRKGLYALVASNRPDGTTALLEDIAVPVENLYKMCEELKGMFKSYGYSDSVIFGHAKDGNIHFLLNEDFANPKSVDRYRRFTEEMVDKVLALQGTLKAEHGTGRIMAPFLERQYGAELYEVMCQIKKLIDPKCILNPGVLIPITKLEHIENLKVPFPVETEINQCVECGYCEPSCPSKDLTLTPRQRIVLRREIKRLEGNGDYATAKSIRKDYDYAGIDTCAVDGLCQAACPVRINTGDLVQNLRIEKSNKTQEMIWTFMAKNWKASIFSLGRILTFASYFPKFLFTSLKIPIYSPDLPKGGRTRGTIEAQSPDLIFFPSCTNSLFAPSEFGSNNSLQLLLERSGMKIATPSDVANLCCGTPWKSKGRARGYSIMKTKLLAALDKSTKKGKIEVTCDSSSCSEGLKLVTKGTSIKASSAIDFVALQLLNKLEIKKKFASITIHQTCSDYRSGSSSSLMSIASAISDSVVVPDDWGCCGFAGDRGMLHPELTASATNAEAKSVRNNRTSAYASTNRTCEIALSRATEQSYTHILELLEEATR